MLVQALYYIFAAILVTSALALITARNPVHSALALVMCFFTSACLWMLVGAEFLAIVLVLVYVGAVMVLFLFVVMMLDINIEELRRGFTRFAWLGWLTAAAVILEIVGVIVARNFGANVHQGIAAPPAAYSNTAELGAVLYTQYAYPFELAAVLLLVAIIAAITLTMRRRPNYKVQDIARQVAVRAKDRVRIVKLEPERRTAGAGDAAHAAQAPAAEPEKRS